MDREFQGRVLRVFGDSLHQAVGDRLQYIASACAGDLELREEVENLMSLSGEAEDFIEEPLQRLPGRSAFVLKAGDVVDRYRIQGVLGRGGMGTVYLATRDDPMVDLPVALKVLNPDRTDDEAINRFRAEVQILAKLEHPNIVRPLDRGVTEDGRPFLVMERIRGEPIDRYCEINKLSVAERLELFRKVCTAVHFAHQKLIVHRDLKPSNILVTDQGEPKLLDFGIARLVEPSPYSTSAETLRYKTAAGFLGTLRYASPEQVRNTNGLTTTGDVYSLGVVLYEILTGHYPYQKWGGSFLDLSDAICNEEPKKPSTVVGIVGEEVSPEGERVELTPESVSATRGQTPGTLKHRLSGDLDCIVLKALRKEAHARYASADELSEDLRRHQEKIPIEARRATFTYHAGRFIRRHRFQVAAAGGLLLVIIGFGLAMAWLWQREQEARESQERALSVSDYIGGLFEIRNPKQGDEITAREIVDQGIVDLRETMRMDELTGEERTRLEDQLPEDLPGLMGAFGWAYYGLADYEEAESWLEKSLDRRRKSEREPTPDLVIALVHLSATRDALGKTVGAAALRSEALDSVRRGVVDDRRLAQVLNELAVLLEDRAAYQAAAEIYSESLPMKKRVFGAQSAALAIGWSNYAALLAKLGRFEEAETLYRESLALRKRLFGAESDAVANCLYSLAALLRDIGSQEPEPEVVWREAIQLFRKSLEIRLKLYPANDLKVAYVELNLAVQLQLRGTLEEAGELYARALDTFTEHYGEDDNAVGTVLRHQATWHQAMGDSEAAVVAARAAVGKLRMTLGADHARTADAESVLGGCLLDLGDIEAAAPLIERSLPVIEAANGDRSRVLIEARHRVERLESLRSPAPPS